MPKFWGHVTGMFSFNRIFASVLLINVTEMSCKNRLCPSLLKCSKRCSCKQASPLAFFLSLHYLIVWVISGTICGTTNILLKTSLTCQKIYQAFVVTVKAMVNFIWRMGDCAGKCFRFRYIVTYLWNLLHCIYKILSSFPLNKFEL